LGFAKLGLAHAPHDWRQRWAEVQAGLGPGPAWIAVAYADHRAAHAPAPLDVLEAAVAHDAAGLLLDTWDKQGPGLDLAIAEPLVRATRQAGLRVALAGKLDTQAIMRLAPLRPDLFALRSAACVGGDRRAAIDPERVATLVATVRAATPHDDTRASLTPPPGESR
jgi:uncharacterized protein (UPF0264 family)